MFSHKELKSRIASLEEDTFLLQKELNALKNSCSILIPSPYGKPFADTIVPQEFASLLLEYLHLRLEKSSPEVSLKEEKNS